MTWMMHGAAEPPSGAGPHVYLFNHIPRTGGGAVGELLESLFPAVRDYPKGPDPAHLAAWLATPVALDTLADGVLLLGHYTAPGGRLHQRYPQTLTSSRYRLITFVREPAAWIRSNLRYFWPQGADLENTPNILAGAYSKAFDTPPLSPKAALDRYWFVGTTESTQECCDRLLQAVGAKTRRIERRNPSPSPHAEADLKRATARCLADSPHDVAVYTEARRRVYEWITGGGSPP